MNPSAVAYNAIAGKNQRYREKLELHPNSMVCFGVGPIPPRAVLIGGRPDDSSAGVGLPFFGMTGQFLGSILATAQLGRELLYLTYGVKHISRPGTLLTAAEQRDKAWPFLRKELKVIGGADLGADDRQPPACRLMLIMGRLPAVMLLGPDGMKKKMGDVLRIRVGSQEWTAVVTSDPGEALRNGTVKAQFIRDVALLGAFTRGNATLAGDRVVMLP
jgi:uracil-DNA glycosylase family 4